MGDTEKAPEEQPLWLKKIEDKLSLITSIDQTVKNNEVQLKDMLNNIELISTKMKETSNQVAEVQKENLELKFTNAKMKVEISQLKGQVNYLEAQSRRNNLLFDGIEEVANENWEKCEKNLIQLLNEHLDTGEIEFTFERVHRIGPMNKTDTKPRTVVAKFTSYKQRDFVWQNRAEMKGTKIWISEDFPKTIAENRKKLLPIFLAAKRSTQINSCALTLDRLYINNKLFTVETINQIPEFLKPENSHIISTDSTVVFSSKYAVFSNLHECPIKIEGVLYNSTEQYIQVAKARLFNDEDSAKKIMGERDTFTQMMMGKKIRQFNANIWHNRVRNVLFSANLAKYTQNDYAKDALLNTGTRLLGEATIDPLFGIGQRLSSKTVSDTSTWKGQNIMGNVLSEVRDKLRDEYENLTSF